MANRENTEKVKQKVRVKTSKEDTNSEVNKGKLSLFLTPKTVTASTIPSSPCLYKNLSFLYTPLFVFILTDDSRINNPSPLFEFFCRLVDQGVDFRVLIFIQVGVLNFSADWWIRELVSEVGALNFSADWWIRELVSEVGVLNFSADWWIRELVSEVGVLGVDAEKKEGEKLRVGD